MSDNKDLVDGRDESAAVDVLGPNIVALAKSVVTKSVSEPSKAAVQLKSSKSLKSLRVSNPASKLAQKVSTRTFDKIAVNNKGSFCTQICTRSKIRRKPALPRQTFKTPEVKKSATSVFDEPCFSNDTGSKSDPIPYYANGIRKPLRYYIHVGNNSNLIRQQFRCRKGWAASKSPWELSAMNDGAGLKKISELVGEMDFVWCQYKSMMGPFGAYDSAPSRNSCIVNHMSNNSVLTHKYKLHETLASAGALDVAPSTLVIRTNEAGLLDGFERSKLKDFVPRDSDHSKEVFIVKPGASTNRGFGIKVMRGTEKVVADIEASYKGPGPKKKSGKKSWIVQKYIERPLLVKDRKFDIRCFVLLVHNTNEAANKKLQRRKAVIAESKQSNNNDEEEGESQGRPNFAGENSELEFKAFLHSQAYLRTSCNKFSMRNLEDRVTHLTNDYVQNKCKNYGKSELGNKLSLTDFADVLDRSHGPGAGNWVEDVCWPTITDICTRVARAGVKAGIHDSSHKSAAFELFGLDFMVEHGQPGSNSVDDLRLRLIEVNDNPCLEQVCPLLRSVIGKVVEDTFEIVLDCNFTTRPQLKKPTNQFARLF